MFDSAFAYRVLNSGLGNVPRERSVEGIRLTSERNNTEYTEEARGRHDSCYAAGRRHDGQD